MDHLQNRAVGEVQPRRIVHGQFSLWSMMALLSVACIVAGAVHYSRLRSAALRDAFGARHDSGGEELGQALPTFDFDVGLPDNEPAPLEVTDPERVYVRGMASSEELAWRFRVHVPPGRQWRWGISHGEHWDQQANQFRNCMLSDCDGLSGESVIDIAIVRDSAGQNLIWATIDGRGTGTTIEEPGPVVLQSHGEQTIRLLGQQMQEVYPATGRIVLLQFHRQQAAVAGGTATPSSRGPRKRLAFGFSFFLEAAPQGH